MNRLDFQNLYDIDLEYINTTRICTIAEIILVTTQNF